MEVSVGVHEWNVVVSVRDDAYDKVAGLLHDYGAVTFSDYYNVLLLHVADCTAFMKDLQERVEAVPKLREGIGHVVPISVRFSFQSVEEFEIKTKAQLEKQLAEVSGKSFYIRVHRRGFKGQMSSQEEARRLGAYLRRRAAARGQNIEVSFDDPDVVIIVEVVGQEAGVSWWSREAQQEFTLLGLG